MGTNDFVISAYFNILVIIASKPWPWIPIYCMYTLCQC